MQQGEVRYGYRATYLWRRRVLVAVPLAMFLVIGIYIAISAENILDKDSLGGLALVFANVSFFAVGLRKIILVNAEIRISTEGVAAHIPGGAKPKFVPWNKLIVIERVRTFQTMISRYQYYYVLRSERDEIRFDDEIENLPTLLKVIEEQSAKLHIPMISVDWGRDALRTGAATDGDAKRRFWRQEAIRTSIERL